MTGLENVAQAIELITLGPHILIASVSKVKPDRGRLSWLCSACFVVQGPEEPGQHAVVVH